MSTYDILMLAVFAGAILFGAWKGLAWQIASVAAVVVSYFVALNFREPVAAYIDVEEPLNKFIAMLALFLGTSLVIWLIFGRIRAQIKRMNMGGFDRQAGALVGAFKGALLCMVITMFATTLLGDGARQSIVNSRSGGYIARGINSLSAVVPDELHAVLAPYVDKFNQAYIENGQGSGALNPEGQVQPQQQVQNGQPNYGGQMPNTQFDQFGNPINNNGGGFQNSSYQQPQGNYSGNQYEVRGQVNQNPNGQTYQQYQGQYQVNRNQNYPNQGGQGYPNQGYPNGNYQNTNPNTNWQNPNGGYPNPRYSNGGQSYPNNQNPNQNYSQQNNSGSGVIRQGENGWPEINVPINTKDVWDKTKDAAMDAARRALENGTSGNR